MNLINLKYILAIESSCDDCAVAILDSSGKILSDTVYSKVELYSEYGGIVPEIASRMHIEKIAFLVKKTIDDSRIDISQIGLTAVTNQPGLIGSLLVGIQFSKGFSQGLRIPLIGINHIEGHLFAGYGEPNFPTNSFIGLIASGGHSALYICNADDNIKLLGQTRDDAAGEALDKIGRLLGFNYPAGIEIDKQSQLGNPNRFCFPIAFKSKDSLEFSFSGLKTAAKIMIEKNRFNSQDIKDFCASLQRVVSETLIAKTKLACEKHGIKKIVIGGGVAANSRLRLDAANLEDLGFQVYIPLKSQCTDNASMIGRAALNRLNKSKPFGNINMLYRF